MKLFSKLNCYWSTWSFAILCPTCWSEEFPLHFVELQRGKEPIIPNLDKPSMLRPFGIWKQVLL